MEPKGPLLHCQEHATWATAVQSVPPPSTSWRSIVIWSSHLCLGLPSGLFLSVLPIKTLYLLSPLHATCPAHFILDWYLAKYLVRCTDHKAPCYVVFSTPVYFVLRLKCPPKHPILEDLQPTFPQQCDTRSSTCMQNDRQSCGSVYLKPCFLIANWKTKDSAPNDGKHSLTSICS